MRTACDPRVLPNDGVKKRGLVIIRYLLYRVFEETDERLLLGRPVSGHRFEPMNSRYERLL